MYRILSVLVLVLASLLGSHSAFAEEPAVGTPEGVLVAHYRARLAEIDELLSGVKEREVLMRCAEARTTYRATTVQLYTVHAMVARTEAELARLTSSTTTASPDPYQNTLAALKAELNADIVSLEAEISAAKAAAADAGRDLLAARQTIDALREEKKFVEGEIGRLTGITPVYAASIRRRLVVGGEYPSIPLSAEFSVCFPQEVGK